MGAVRRKDASVHRQPALQLLSLQAIAGTVLSAHPSGSHKPLWLFRKYAAAVCSPAQAMPAQPPVRLARPHGIGADCRLEAKQLLKSTWQLLYSNLWLVVGLFLLADVATWLLHRVAHRLTNQRKP